MANRDGATHEPPLSWQEGWSHCRVHLGLGHSSGVVQTHAASGASQRGLHSAPVAVQWAGLHTVSHIGHPSVGHPSSMHLSTHSGCWHESSWAESEHWMEQTGAFLTM